ncbi:MAG: hypothetical protein ACFUZC_04175 [Chthoniobacteraceae bacterium]
MKRKTSCLLMRCHCPVPCQASEDRSQSGVALVIVLAIVVLMVGVVMAFFSQSLLQRQISKSSASQTSVEIFAHGALNTIISDLQQEIIAGSTVSSTNNVSLYIPTAAANVVPTLAGVTGGTGTENLLKRSAYNVPVFAGGSSRAAQSSTTDVSANGRYVTRARWNKPLLMAKASSDSATDLKPVSIFSAPDWILVNCGGGNPTTWNTNMIWSGSAANTNVVVGRYAYTIYNEGGLLDANVAGYPADAATSTGTTYSYKSAMAFADLTQIRLTQQQVNALVGWRNQASLQVSGTLPNYALDTSANGQTNYYNFVTSNGNGFLTTSNTTTNTASGATDHQFVSRQNLMNFLLNGVAQSTAEKATLQNALQYLGTFSREVDAPSYTPSATRPKVDSVTDDQFNPSLIDTRVSGTFTRDSDGKTATIGEPLLKHRFPLSRLAWIGYNGPNGATAAQIYNAFGLTWYDGVWVYNHGNSAQILKLSEVASAKREPDFFELLQAGIVIGSLGKTMPSGYVTADAVNEDANTYYQIVQIAANLIDQYDADSYPTRFSFGGKEIDGIENLPYLSRVWEVPFRIGNNVGIWYQPEVWNPHANVASSGGEPSQFRYVVDGMATAVLTKSGTSSAGATTTFSSTSSDAGIHFLNTSVFSQPQILSSSIGATASGSNSVSSGGTSFLGVFAGSVSNAARDMTGAYISINSSTPVSHRLQYYNGSNWVTYCEFRYVKGGITTTTSDAFDAYWPRVFPVRSDPRTDRFGVLGGYTTSHTYYATNQTLRPGTDNGYSQNSGIRVPSPTGWVYATGPSAYMGTLSDNKITSVTRYADSDGVVRGAMGVYNDGTTLDGLPLATGSLDSRPLVLNRPFRSVAEMGYASRGMPWKDLDFFTDQSGDAALLDLFCLHEPTSSGVVAGRVNLNTKQIPVLKAVLSGAIRAESVPTVISADTADTFASSLVSLTSNIPLINLSDLVVKWIGVTSVVPAATSDDIIKWRREAPIRALADVGNIRTWNLLIDIIAQSGRYATSAKSLSQFTVDGERRYWLHVAVDRYTGKVIAQSLELVYE